MDNTASDFSRIHIELIGGEDAMNIDGESEHHPLYYSFQRHIEDVKRTIQMGEYSPAAFMMIGVLGMLHPRSRDTPEFVHLMRRLKRAHKRTTRTEINQLYTEWYRLIESEGYTSDRIIDFVLGGELCG